MGGAPQADGQQVQQGGGGSWIPLIVASCVMLLRWLLFGQGGTPVKLRRWFNIQRVSWKKKLGYRDESRYQMSAGDGANQRYKRQG
eukprot:scaffold171769_cov39-Attheya_sp.AAC.1